MREMRSSEIKNEAIRLYGLGVSTYEIGSMLGIGHNTVSKWANAAGLYRGKGRGCAAESNAKRNAEAKARIASALGDRFEVIELRPGSHATLRCKACGEVFERTVDLRYPTTCFNCERIEAEKKATERREKAMKRTLMQRLVNVIAHKHVCPECGTVFRSPYSNKVYCSEQCGHRAMWKRKARKNGSSNSHVARAKRYGVKYDRSVTLKKLLERDGMICYICGKRCTKDDTRWGSFGPDYPTVDHVIPMSKGGTHTWDNVRIACAECNEAKGSTLEGPWAPSPGVP